MIATAKPLSRDKGKGNSIRTKRSQQINFGAEIFAPVNVIIVDYTALTLED